MKIVITARNFSAYDSAALQLLRDAGHDVIDLSANGFGVSSSESDMIAALSDADIEESGMSITRLLVLAGIEKSNSAAIRSVREGGVSVNDRKVTDTKAVLDSAELADGIILKKGKKTFVRLIHKD